MTHTSLSPRLVEILRARCETGSRKAAAERLGISEWAVGRHLRLLQDRCGCRDDAQACWEHHAEMEAVG